MTHNQIDESFCSYLGSNLFIRPSITAFLKREGISYYNYKKNYENDLEFIDEISIYIFSKYYLDKTNHLPFKKFLNQNTSYFVDILSSNIDKIKSLSDEQLRKNLEEINYYFSYYVTKIYHTNIVEVGSYYVNLANFLQIYLNILNGIVNVVKNSENISKQKISLLLDVFFEKLNIYSSFEYQSKSKSLSLSKGES